MNSYQSEFKNYYDSVSSPLVLDRGSPIYIVIEEIGESGTY